MDASVSPLTYCAINELRSWVITRQTSAVSPRTEVMVFVPALYPADPADAKLMVVTWPVELVTPIAKVKSTKAW